MEFRAHIKSDVRHRQVSLRVGNKEQALAIAPKSSGGSSVSGGELLCLALATCYCNDIYREAAKRGLQVEGVQVEVEGDFEAEGQPASNIVYWASVDANASEEDIRELMLFTDTVSEVQNTLRTGVSVKLEMQHSI